MDIFLKELPKAKPHVDLIEGSQHSVGILRIFQTLGDPLTHSVNFYADLET